MRKTLLILALFIFNLLNAQSPSGCDATDWPETVYHTGNGVAFSVPEAPDEGWTYKWVVTSPNLDIVSGQGTPTVYIKGNMGYESGTVYVVKCKEFESACSDMKTVTIKTLWEPIPTLTCFGYEPIVPEDTTLEGTLNVCVISSVTDLVAVQLNLTFTWYIKFENGELLELYGLNPVFREKCLENPVKSIGLVISNGLLSKKFYAGAFIGIHHIPGFGILDQLTSCFTGSSCNDNDGGLLFRDIQVYPNPTSSTLQFEGIDSAEYSLTIYNKNGFKILEEDSIDQKITIKEQPNGIYFYVLKDRNGNEKTGKIIKN